MGYDIKRLQDVRGKVAIVGVGETDYYADYHAQRGNTPGYVPLDHEGLAALAFSRALEDSGLKREDIDGYATSVVDHENIGSHLGLKGSYDDTGFSWDLIDRATHAIASGQCNTIALIFGNAQRSAKTQFGGAEVNYGPATYRYYHPWGWSSQPAHWAMMFKSYQLKYGVTEEQLGAVALTFRHHASLNENAVMQTPITLDDYLAARYIVRPLRLFDFCLVNDGGVCVILQRSDMAKDGRQVPVHVEGLGTATGGADNLQLRPLVEDHLRDLVGRSRDMAFGMAGLNLKDIDTLNIYDAGSAHVPFLLEGLGYCKPGEALDFVGDGHIALGGSLPTNTDGGQLSGSYLQGWSQVVECVRQLRWQAGRHQVNNAQRALFCIASGLGSHSIIFRRGAR